MKKYAALAAILVAVYLANRHAPKNCSPGPTKTVAALEDLNGSQGQTTWTGVRWTDGTTGAVWPPITLVSFKTQLPTRYNDTYSRWDAGNPECVGK